MKIKPRLLIINMFNTEKSEKISNEKCFERKIVVK